MRTLAIGVGVLLAALAFALGRSCSPPAARLPQVADADPPRDDPRIAELERRVGELAVALDALRAELSRAELPRAPVASGAPAAASAPPSTVAGERGAAWYLAQYVASFEGGGQGSEYFRLAVEAFVPSLLREIAGLVLDPRAAPALRRSLVAMLGDARLRSNGTAIDVLLRLLPTRDDDVLVEMALVSLARVGDPATAHVLEGLVWSIAVPDNRWKAVQTLVALAGDDANAALLRLWPGAPTDADRAFLVAQAQTDGGDEALRLLEHASQASVEVRLQAARAVGEFRSPAFGPFVDAWLLREPDEGVRTALGAAQRTLAEPPRWSASRATGPPDADPQRDDPNAWASAQPDMGEQWLELGYDPPLRASAARIFEVCVPGAVSSIVAIDERDGRHALWSGIDPTATPGVFEVAFAPTAFRIRALRITLDTDRRPGWSEIDAVELLGPDGRAWASSARASSHFGQR